MRMSESVETGCPVRSAGVWGKTQRWIPCVGITPAGGPQEVEVPGLKMMEVPGTFGQCKHLVALQVSGESMLDAHILPGDIVVIHRQAHAAAGDLVVVETPEGWTLKRWEPKGLMVRLRAENTRVPDRWFRIDSVRVWGVVVGVLRKYR